ncbi:MAG: ABC transporter permease [Bacteroides sp.]|nr:ABC transporter permease [Bacteroides sp.]
MATPSSHRYRGSWLAQTGRAFRREWHIIFSDMGVMLFLLALPLLYPVIYTLIYNPEIVTEMPMAVVDRSMSAESRSLVQTIEASPSVAVYDYCPEMGEAKRLFAERKVSAILEIPSDYARCLATGEQAHVQLYVQTSLLLRYRAFLETMADVQVNLASEMAASKAAAMGMTALDLDVPVRMSSSFIGVPGQGFASFIMPGIVILILQQSMVLGICFIAGSSRERRRRFYPLADPLMMDDISPVWAVLGKTLTFTVMYIPATIYVVRFIPEMFGLPHVGAPVDYLLYLLPLLLSTAMFGQVVQILCKERESAFIVVVFTSVLFLFLSGLTWPRYAMSRLWTWLGDLVPATWGLEGFVRINSNAATLAENSTPFIAMWILAAVYFVGAIWVTYRIRRKG